VGDQFINCNTCNSPCGQACGFSTAPTVTQVTTSCPPYPAFPLLEGTVADTQCYTFTAVNTTVSFNVILNSTCGTGNVSNFTWNLYSSGCGSAIQTGTLSNLTFPNLTIGQSYTYCYSFTVPSGCYHSIYYPYFVGAAPVLLPVELIRFEAKTFGQSVRLEWTTASETNNDYFVIERSTDGADYLAIGSVNGNGTTSAVSEYEFVDPKVPYGLLYYRLRQVDADGKTASHPPVVVRVEKRDMTILIHPNPSKGNPSIDLNLPDNSSDIAWSVKDLIGHQILGGTLLGAQGSFKLDFGQQRLLPGTYLLQVASQDRQYVKRFQVTE
ncbi:MAG: hypothetical protein ACKO7B_21715, partial [Flavobacteriales bacterium]